jgi:hypothetical protein
MKDVGSRNPFGMDLTIDDLIHAGNDRGSADHPTKLSGD